MKAILEQICASEISQAVALLGPIDTIYNELLDYLQSKLDYADSHPDVVVLEPESPHPSVKIDQVRSLLSRLSVRPFYGMYYVIIPNASSLSEGCYNALLKTLEESKRVWFFLIYEHESEIPKTIASRCLKIRHDLADPTDERAYELYTCLQDLSMDSPICAISDHWLSQVDSVDMWLNLLWTAHAMRVKSVFLSDSIDIPAMRSIDTYGTYLEDLKLCLNGQSSLQLKRCIDQTLIRSAMIAKT